MTMIINIFCLKGFSFTSVLINLIPRIGEGFPIHIHQHLQIHMYVHVLVHSNHSNLTLQYSSQNHTMPHYTSNTHSYT